jgi:hypothetical protein
MKKAKVHKFWITSSSSVGTSDYKLFVSKADYDHAMKRVKELETKLKGTSIY